MNAIQHKRHNTRALTESAIMIALATILSLIKLYELPWGGSVTLASMLPLVIIGYRHGVKWGVLSSLVYSIMQMIFGFSTISAAFLPGDNQMQWYNAVLMVMLDYVFAFSLVGFSGLFRYPNNPSRSLAMGSLVGTLSRFIMHILSGWILWGAWAASFFQNFDETTGGTFGTWIINTFNGQALAMIYSIIYNAFYMIPEIVLTTLLAFWIGKISFTKKQLTYKR